jgi:hypothetical protein
MLYYIPLGLLVVILALLGFATTRPDSFRVERSITVKAPAEKVVPLLNDFHNWGVWSPWEKLDPAMKRTHSGAANGVGAIYEWSGNDKAGAGRMEMTDATPTRVVIKLDFLKPFEGHNTSEFVLAPSSDGGTLVTWAMYGPNTFMGKLMSVFISMDAFMSKDFESGLAALKAASEK